MLDKLLAGMSSMDEAPNGWRLRSTPAQRPVGVGMPLQGIALAWVGRDNAVLAEPA